jgi:3-oxoacyl-[acyl-carrier protein] reductase
LKAEIEGLGAQAIASQCDVSSTDAAAEMVKQVKEAFGRIDFLINNAGITRDNLILRMKEADWDSVLDTNLKGAWNFSRSALRHMLRQEGGGSILNISSISGVVGMGGQSNYSASKAGVVAMTVVWAKELARYGIRTGAIAPGFTRTEILDAMKPEMIERALNAVPLKRMAEPAEMAHAAVFIAENDYFSGRVVEVDGGQRI